MSSGDNGGGCLAYLKSTAGREALWYLLFTVVSIVLGIIFTDVLDPRERPIPVQQLAGDDSTFIRDLSFDYHSSTDTISTPLGYVICGCLPLFHQCWLEYMRSGRDIAKVFETISIYLTVLGVSLLASEPTKWYVSWQRPNFFQVCEPDEATYTTCTGEDNYILAVYSFPSGHALTAFSGLTVFTCYLHFHYGVPAYMRQLRRARWEQALNNIVKDNKQGDNDDNDPAIVEIADEDDDNNNNNNNSKPKATTTITVDPGTLAWYRLRSMLAFVIPQGLALFVSVSRIKDNRHFPADVLAGALIGSVSALFITSLWWFETE